MRSNEKILLAVAGWCALSLLLHHLLSVRTALPALDALHPYLLFTATLCGMLWARNRFHRLAEEEQRDQTAADKTDSTLFRADDPAIDPLSFVHARAQFEKWFIPFLAPLLAVTLAFWAWRLQQAGVRADAHPDQRLFGAALLLGQGFLLFLLGRFFLGLSQSADHRLMRGPANLLLLSALLTALTGVGALVAHLGWPPADRLVRWIAIGYLWVLSTELALNTIAFLYRPNRPDTAVTTYESRLTSLLTDPRSWTTGLAQTLDYQFGFHVSDTGFYRFLRRALLPLAAVQILLLYALSTLVVLGPEEEAILERLGNPYTETGAPRLLTSGIHLKWPWPFDTVRRYPARRVLTTHIGFQPHPDAPRPPLMLWTVPHYQSEDQFVVASRDDHIGTDDQDAAVPVNFISVNLGIEYRITNLFDYVYAHRDTDELLRLIATRALTRELAGRDLIDLLGAERQQAADNLRTVIQKQADAHALGLEILFLGLHGAHPPIPVSPAFENVIGSLEQRETAILEARAYRNRVLPLATAEGDALVWEARADQARRTNAAAADAAVFRTRQTLATDLPRVYPARLHLDALSRALGPLRKYVVVASPDLEVITLNFEDRMRPELFDFGPGGMEDRFL
jgi:regulator of protease activity HflC (stomatin/prohibitin superfamily)